MQRWRAQERNNVEERHWRGIPANPGSFEEEVKSTEDNRWGRRESRWETDRRDQGSKPSFRGGSQKRPTMDRRGRGREQSWGERKIGFGGGLEIDGERKGASNELEKKLEESNNEKQRLEQELKKMEAEQHRKQQESAAVSSGAQPTAAVDGLLSTAERAKALKTEMERFFGSYTEELDKICQQLEPAEKEFQRKAKELDEVKAQYSRLKDVCTEYKSQLYKTQAALATNQKETEQLRDEFRKIKKQNESLQSDFQQVQEDNKRLFSESELLQGRVSLLDKELRLQQAQLSDASTNLDTVNPGSDDEPEVKLKECKATDGEGEEIEYINLLCPS